VPVLGSPFPVGGVGLTAAGIDCNCASTRLYVGDSNGSSAVVSVFNIGSGGVLSQLAGSPFTGPGINSNVVLLSPDDRHLFVSNQFSNTIDAFNVAGNGALSLVTGSPFLTPASAPIGLSIDTTGRFLYVADYTNQISAFRIADTGALTVIPGGLPFVGPGLGLESLTVFPPKRCCDAPDIDGVSASPNVLWPPNHEMIPVHVAYTVTGCPSTCMLTVSSNEGGNAPESGNPNPNWQVIDANHVLLRAERDGGDTEQDGEGAGRVYTINIMCTNNTDKKVSTHTVTVSVPHDQGH